MKQKYTSKLTEDVSFEKYLNESFQRLYEYYHKLTDFVEFINQTTEHIVHMKQYEDFDTEYVWNSKERKCYRELKTYDYEYEIIIKFFYEQSPIKAYVDMSENQDDDIVIYLNIVYLKSKRNVSKLTLESFIKGILHHELIHIFHNFIYGHNVLNNRKNISDNIIMSQLPESIQKKINPSMLNALKNVIYYSAPTEREARLNGFIGYLETFNRYEIRSLLKQFYKDNNSFNVNKITPQNLVEFGDEFSSGSEYKNAVDRINDYAIVSNKIILLLGYLYEHMNLFHTKPHRISEDYVINYIDSINTKPTDENLEIINSVINYTNSTYKKFMKDLYSIAYSLIQRKQINR